MPNYFKEIERLIENTEVNKRVRQYKDNSETLHNYWNIGKLLIEAQGGDKRAKYGNGLIKEWSLIFVSKYGKDYEATKLRKMRQYFLEFEKCVTVSRISWSHIVEVLPVKNESARNYYLNLVILNNLSIRELRNQIKSKAYDRLSYADKENIKLIEESNHNLTIEDMIKDPILIKATNTDVDEKALHKYIIEMVSDRFLELGTGFSLVGHEYKLYINNKTYKIDLLFFNIKLNSYIVVEIKTNKLQHKDISQLQFYVNYIDRNIKEQYNNKTIGILLVKKNDKLVIEYTTSNDIYVTTYELIK